MGTHQDRRDIGNLEESTVSYCRFGWEGSNVYVYESAQGIECCGCHLEKEGFTAKDPEEMIAHLGRHRRLGDYVPEDAILALWEDIPGAQRSGGEDPVFTKTNLEMHIIQLQLQINRLNEAPPSEIEKTVSDLVKGSSESWTGEDK